MIKLLALGAVRGQLSARMKRTVIIHSGGMDSTVLLAHLLAEGREVHALSIDYGQRHRRELIAAAEICTHYKVPHLSLIHI